MLAVSVYSSTEVITADDTTASVFTDTVNTTSFSPLRNCASVVVMVIDDALTERA